MVEWLLKYWLQVLFTGVTGALGFTVRYIWKIIRKEHKEQALLRDGVLALLRNSLIEQHDHWMTKQYIPVHALDGFDKAYEVYTNLGGNGTVPGLHKQIHTLPTTKPRPPKEGNTCLKMQTKTS